MRGSAASTSSASAISPVAVNLTGTDGNDVLEGSDLGDTLSGGAGNDTLYGYGGLDLISGGDGDDLLDGGAGDDRLIDRAGTNILRGGDGDDILEGGHAGLLDGGAGDDWLSGYDGMDYSAGSGDDLIAITIASTTGLVSHVDGGVGNDRIGLSLSADTDSTLTVSGGAGSDTFGISGAAGTAPPKARIDITDFTAGAGGDTINIASWLAPDSSDNPFATGALKLQADGADTLLQVRQGTSGTAYTTIARLEHVDAADLTRANFVGGIDPHGGVSGVTLSGTAGGETLTGFNWDDTLYGLDGNDTLRGFAGNDLLDGGNDILYGDEGNDVLMGGAGNDRLIDGDGDNRLFGGDGNDYLEALSNSTNFLDGGNGDDLLRGGSGDDLLDGGAGRDKVEYEGARASYQVSHDVAGWHVTDLRTGPMVFTEGSDTLKNVERIGFADQTLALDIDGSAGQAYRIYQAAFDRTPDAVGLGFWINALDKGVALHAVADGFVDSQEFKDVYGAAPSNAELVSRLYQNILHRAPEQGGYDFWVGVLDNKQADVADVLAAFSESSENQAGVAELIAGGILFTPYLG